MSELRSDGRALLKRICTAHPALAGLLLRDPPAFWYGNRTRRHTVPRPYRWHVETQERLFSHLRRLWDDDRPRIFVDLGCHAGHGRFLNMSDALYWLHFFRHPGGTVLAVDTFGDWVLDVQHRLDSVEPYRSVAARKLTLELAIAAVDGGLADMSGPAATALDCCFADLEAGRWCGTKWRELEARGVVDHLCRIPRQRLHFGEARAAARRAALPLPPSPHGLELLRRGMRGAPLPRSSYMVRRRRLDSLWRHELGGRRIDFLKVDIDTDWTAMGLEGLLEARGFAVATLEVDGSWGGLSRVWGVTRVDQLAWLAAKHGYASFLKLPCPARAQRSGAAPWAPFAEGDVDALVSASYWPLQASHPAGSDAPFEPTAYASTVAQDMLLVDRSLPELVSRLPALGAADCLASSLDSDGAVSELAARRWLRGAAVGHCGTTAWAPPGECRAGATAGVLGLLPDETTSWLAATRACLARCARCAACHFISVSLRWRDCSFYAACDLTSLHTDVQGFRSGLAITRSPI